MAIDAFLYFPRKASIKVEGESTDTEFNAKGAFELKTFGFGATNSLTIGSSTGGGGGGKTDFNPFDVSKVVDTASCPLYQVLTLSQHIPEAVLELRRAGSSDTKSGATFLKIHFLTVVVSSITWAGDEETVTEDLQFEYGAMKIEYSMQDKAGKLRKASGDKGEAKWSRVLNAPKYQVK